MNTLGSHCEGEGTPEESLGGKSSIASFFEQGVAYYEELQDENMRPGSDMQTDDPLDISYQREILYTLAREAFKEALSHVATEEQQLLKISSLLFLVRLHDTEELGYTYFYDAVDMARRHLGEHFQESEIGAQILKVYLSIIEPRFSRLLSPEDMEFGIQKAYVLMLAETDRREALKTKRIQDIRQSPIDALTYQETLDELEGLIGPFRLLVIAEESSETILSHRFDESDTEPLTHLQSTSRQMHVEIFDKQKIYRVRADRGSAEKTNTFSDDYWESVIAPVIGLIIQRKEYVLFLCTLDNIATIELKEADVAIIHPAAYYRSFVSRVFAHNMGSVDTEHPNQEDGLSLDACLKAIDICRYFTRESRSQNKPRPDELGEIIDQILGGRMDRQVLHMVQSILISRNETMNGTGFPYGLSKKNIPLLTRIYSLIRSYEALSCLKTPIQVISTLKEWGAGGYFDHNVLAIFLEESEAYDTSRTTVPEGLPELEKIPIHRQNRYETWIRRWYRILSIADQIEDNYEEVRVCKGDREIQSRVFLKINKLRLDLLKIADIRKLIIVSRHGETPSDTEQGRPGNDQEVLNERGIATSKEKGMKLQGLRLRIFSSPLLRARQTAQIVCRSMRKSVQKIIDTDPGMAEPLSSPAIILEKSITNPPKNRDDDRYYSYGWKLFSDPSNARMNEFLTQLVSAPDESMNLFIAHRDSGRNLIFWLNNLFVQDGVSGEKTPIENDRIYELLFRGDGLVHASQDPSRALMFSLTNWKDVLNELDLLCLDIFGETFHTSSPETPTNLISLHDLVLDFLDSRQESSPEQVTLFLERAEANLSLKHIIPVLRAEMIVGHI